MRRQHPSHPAQNAATSALRLVASITSGANAIIVCLAGSCHVHQSRRTAPERPAVALLVPVQCAHPGTIMNLKQERAPHAFRYAFVS
jgi:hypothetical protein